MGVYRELKADLAPGDGEIFACAALQASLHGLAAQNSWKMWPNWSISIAAGCVTIFSSGSRTGPRFPAGLARQDRRYHPEHRPGPGTGPGP